MTILIALVPGRSDTGALHLGAMLARSSVEDVTVVSVVPAPWPPDPYRADEEYLALQESIAETTLTNARQHLGGAPLGVDTVVRRASSVSAGLLEVITERNVSMVVVGSSSSGLLGRVMLGGVVERVLHSNEVPVAISPRGFHPARDTEFTRISVALGRADRGSRLLTRAASTARAAGVALRVVCFAVRPAASLAVGLPEGAERLVVDEWVGGLERDVATALEAGRQDGDGAVSTQVEITVGEGATWSEALYDVAWADGDVLVVGTSSSPLNRFLGSHASKIVRSCPVPVVLLARA